MAEFWFAFERFFGFGGYVVPKWSQTFRAPTIVSLVDRNDEAPLIPENGNDFVVLRIHASSLHCLLQAKNPQRVKCVDAIARSPECGLRSALKGSLASPHSLKRTGIAERLNDTA